MCQLSFKRHRFPAEVISHSIWLYTRFTLSYRDVEEMLAERYWLWRAVGNEGEVLDCLVQSHRNAKAVRKLLKKQDFALSRLVAGKLPSYPSAFRAISLVAEHDRGLRADNRTENSHQPARRRERKLQRFRSPGSAQHFLSIHSATYNTFYHQRHLLKRPILKELRTASFEVWQSASVAA